MNQPEKSTEAGHALKEHHNILFHQTKLVVQTDCPSQLPSQEIYRDCKNPHHLNRETRAFGWKRWPCAPGSLTQGQSSAPWPRTSICTDLQQNISRKVPLSPFFHCQPKCIRFVSSSRQFITEVNSYEVGEIGKIQQIMWYIPKNVE